MKAQEFPPASSATPPIILGISGASGAVYGIELLKALKAARVETHLVITKMAQVTIAHETGYSVVLPDQNPVLR